MAFPVMIVVALRGTIHTQDPHSLVVTLRDVISADQLELITRMAFACLVMSVTTRVLLVMLVPLVRMGSTQMLRVKADAPLA